MGSSVKVAVVVGSAGAFGGASAAALASRGACVGLIDDSFDGCDATLSGFVNAGQVVLLQRPLDDVDSVRSAVDTVHGRFGRIDILVNATVEAGPDGVVDLDEEAWKRCIELNMKLPFFALQACAPHMRASGGGRVVNLSSTLSGMTDGAHGMVLGIAKAGVNSMTRQWAVDLCPDGIVANSLWLGSGPPQELPTPQAVAAFVAFLALDATPYLNGTQIPVDSGSALLRQGRMVNAAGSLATCPVRRSSAGPVGPASEHIEKGNWA